MISRYLVSFLFATLLSPENIRRSSSWLDVLSGNYMAWNIFCTIAFTMFLNRCLYKWIILLSINMLSTSSISVLSFENTCLAVEAHHRYFCILKYNKLKFMYVCISYVYQRISCFHWSYCFKFLEIMWLRKWFVTWRIKCATSPNTSYSLWGYSWTGKRQISAIISLLFLHIYDLVPVYFGNEI